MARMRYRRCLVLESVFLKDRKVCGTVYWNMQLKVNRKVGYCIPVPDFYPVLHGLRCWLIIIWTTFIWLFHLDYQFNFLICIFHDDV